MRHLIQVVDAQKNSADRSGNCCKPAAKAHLDEGKATITEKYCEACSSPEKFEQLQEWDNTF